MDADFEAQVLSKLVLTINVPGPDGVPIGKEDIGNIMFTNDVIKMAATEVQSLPAWQGSKKVQALRFSNRWVASWLGFPLMRTPVSLCAYVVVEFSLWTDMLAASAFFCFMILSCSNNTVAVSD